MMNAQLNGTALGWKTFLNLDGAGRAWPVTWMPYHGETTHFGWRQHGILAHEMSHAFGSPHSGDTTGYQYGSSWDVVSFPSVGCPPFDAEYGCLGQGTVTYGLMRMGFLDPARVFTYDGTPKTVEIERLANPVSTTSTLAAKIAVTGQRFFTIEARHRVGYDAKLPVNGVIISDVDLTRLNVSPAVSYLVAPPGAPADSLGQGMPRGTGHTAAAWTVGSTFVSASAAVSVTVVAETATGFVPEFKPLARTRMRPSRSR